MGRQGLPPPRLLGAVRFEPVEAGAEVAVLV